MDEIERDAEEFEALAEETIGQAQAIQAEGPPWEVEKVEGDPFVEPEGAVVQFILDGHQVVDGKMVVRAHVQAASAEWTIKRGRENYSSDTVRMYSHFVFDNLNCHVVVDKLAAEVQGKGDDLRVVGEVLGQLSKTVGLEAYRRMVQHEQTLYELRNDPPQVTPTRRAEIGKGRRVEPKPKEETL